MICNKHKNVCKILKYTEKLLILISTVTGLCFISNFASLTGIFVGIASSAVGIKIC